MNEIDDALTDFLRSTRNMESSIVSVISDSNRDIELILKELLIYLDATSKNLEKVQNSVSKFMIEYKEDKSSARLDEEIEKVIETIKSYQKRILETETENTKKILEFIRQVGINNQKMLKQLIITAGKITDKLSSQENSFKESSEDLYEIKDILKVMSSELSDTKFNVSKNQDNLMAVINNMMDSETQRSLATEQVQTQKIISEEEKAKAKLALIGKIVGIVLGSGGIVYLIIDILLKAAAGG